MQEEWKDIKGFVGIYKVSSLGNIYSIRSKRNLSTWKDKDGYLRCNLKNRGIVKQASIHRIVASEFIENKNLKPEVNHKNGIRSDNRVENLEWVTTLENQRHKINVLGYVPSKESIKKMIEGAKRYARITSVRKERSERMKKMLSKKIIDLATGKIYCSQKEASEDTGCSQGLISFVCRHKREHTKGHVFRFYPYPVGEQIE